MLGDILEDISAIAVPAEGFNKSISVHLRTDLGAGCCAPCFKFDYVVRIWPPDALEACQFNRSHGIHENFCLLDCILVVGIHLHNPTYWKWGGNNWNAVVYPSFDCQILATG